MKSGRRVTSKGKIIKDQELFFDLHASRESSVSNLSELFYHYVNKEQFNGFKWLNGCKTILDYGCGTGTSIDRFFELRGKKGYFFYGVDIAKEAVKRARIKYPNYKFFVVKNNHLPQIKNNSIDGAYMLHVLHHSRDHQAIFREINSKLKPGGKLLINDLSSKNPINRFFRGLFTKSPKFITSRFGDDLMVEDHIPEKYKIYIGQIKKQLESAGFGDIKVEYGHLFFFIFGWVDRFIPFSKIKIIEGVYRLFIGIENLLLKFKYFQNRAEVISIKCFKI